MRRLAVTVSILCIALSIISATETRAGGQHVVQAQNLMQPPVTGPLFRLPFDLQPGLSTWYVIQFYGNTTGAYRFRDTWYDQGQGLHFGVDFAAKCGTPVVSIGD